MEVLGRGKTKNQPVSCLEMSDPEAESSPTTQCLVLELESYHGAREPYRHCFYQSVHISLYISSHKALIWSLCLLCLS